MSQQSSTGSGPGTPMTPQAAARVQSSAAKANGGHTPAASFSARAQSAAARNSGGKGGGGKK
jgi:hypothetical protein